MDISIVVVFNPDCDKRNTDVMILRKIQIGLRDLEIEK